MIKKMLPMLSCIIFTTFIVPSFSFAEHIDINSIQVSTPEQRFNLGESFRRCIPRGESRGDGLSEACEDFAETAAAVARLCESNAGRGIVSGIDRDSAEGRAAQANSFYAQNDNLCINATNFRGYIINQRFNEGTWQERVKSRVQSMRNRALDEVLGLPVIRDIVRFVPRCNYSFEEDISSPLPEGVNLPHRVTRRDTPGVTANCQF